MFSFWKKKPRQPRKEMIIHGLILMDGHQYAFSSRNISTEGALIHIEEDYLPETGIPVELRIDEFEINGHGEVRWATSIPKGGALVGLKFAPDKGLAGVGRLIEK